MRPAFPLVLALAVSACATQPRQQPADLIPMKQIKTDPKPQGVDQNPIKYEPPPRDRARSALDRLREANQEASRDVFDGYFTGAKVNFRWRDGEVYNLVLAKNRTTTLNL